MAPSASSPCPQGPACPIRTTESTSLQEASGMDVAEIRAYKLGKKRWSYNQVGLVVCEEGTARQLTVKQAVHLGVAPDSNKCGVTFEVQLANDEKLTLDAYLVYDSVKALGEGTEKEHEWTLVDRCACQRGCQGPVLRAIQRFGKLGKRSWGGSPSPDVTDRTNHNMKDMRYMYLSFDEAGTHVACRSFRLVAAIYDENRTKLLGTAVSPPVRVLANNDVPTGAAHLQLMVTLPVTWEGWKSAINPIEISYAQRFAAAVISPSPTKTTPRRKAAAKAVYESEGEDSPSSDDGHAANTPLCMSSGTAADHYQTGRAPYHQEQDAAPSPSPICFSTGNSPSSLLVEATMGRMTPALEIVSHLTQPHSLRAEGSLSAWLEEESKAAAAGAAHPTNQTRQPYIVAGSQRHISKHQKVGIDADAPLPHCPDYEPHFPVLLGTSFGPQQNHQQQQQQQQQQYHYKGHQAAEHHNAGAAPNHAIDDPVAAFVELMMMQTQQQHSEPPVIELPALSHQEQHPAALTPTAAQVALHQLEKLVGITGFGRATTPSPMLPMYVPEATASVATPTPSALDDLFAGVHATFDALQEAAAVHDDASFPPNLKSSFNHPSAFTDNVDATVR
ncbi:hypothetical protein Ndes2526B_g09642 [Nannochloris sp. 'desiccata']|nr:hypothetical protein NADE_007409 [Chlorella desiccata (nom. nud.)]KAH7615798.1 hypothetical protein NADE_007588 [Chlorella desiccata (nom. nud.)]